MQGDAAIAFIILCIAGCVSAGHFAESNTKIAEAKLEMETLQIESNERMAILKLGLKKQPKNVE